MDKVRSADGTRIAYEKTGHGPPLVLVHGTTADHTRWARLLPALEAEFSVLAMDRRGRGQSGDAPVYALEREYEDVVAVVDAAGTDVSLLGHSYGALCALEAALRTSKLRRLVLYEPVFPVDGIELYAPGAARRLEDMLEKGDRDLALTTFLREIAQMSELEVNALRSDPSWQGRLAAAHTVVRELADGDYVFEPERFQRLKLPTLLLVGGESPTMLKAPTEQLAAVLPDCRVVVMPGQGHAAMNTAPELFLREVGGFLKE